MKSPGALAVILGLFALTPAAPPQASTVTVPHTFVNGTTADATQVNANFSALATSINQHAGILDSLQAAPVNPSQFPRWASGTGTTTVVDYAGAGLLQEIEWFVYDRSGFSWIGGVSTDLSTSHSPSFIITIDNDTPQTLLMKDRALTSGGSGVVDSVYTLDLYDPMGATGIDAQTNEWSTFLVLNCKFKTRLKIEVTGMNAAPTNLPNLPKLPSDLMGVQYIVEN